MSSKLVCPSCAAQDIDLHNYESMMVLRHDLALFSLRCPACEAAFSTLQPIPADMRDEVRFAAAEVGAGMGKE